MLLGASFASAQQWTTCGRQMPNNSMCYDVDSTDNDNSPIVSVHRTSSFLFFNSGAARVRVQQCDRVVGAAVCRNMRVDTDGDGTKDDTLMDGVTHNEIFLVPPGAYRFNVETDPAGAETARIQVISE